MLTVSENHNFAIQLQFQVNDGHNAYRGQMNGDLVSLKHWLRLERKNIETQPGLKPASGSSECSFLSLHGVLILEKRIDGIDSLFLRLYLCHLLGDTSKLFFKN